MPTGFTPNVNPANTSVDITMDDIDKTAKQLADNIGKRTSTTIDCMCPKCGYEFEVLQ
jgi:hypothetical protein